MMRLNLLLRYGGVTIDQHQAGVLRMFSPKCFSSKSSSSSSDDEQKKVVEKKRSMEAREKLNLLLNKMIEERVEAKKAPELEFARPKSKRQKDIRVEQGTESVKTEPVEKQIVKAVKDVASTIGGDVKQTESELLQKLLHKEELVATNLKELFKDIKIDKEMKVPEQTQRAEQVRQLLARVKTKQQSKATVDRPGGRRDVRREGGSKNDAIKIIEERVDLFGAEGLGIFPLAEEVAKWEDLDLNKTWKALQKRELRLAVTHPPANYFQEMILWTEQGKLWKFPIDNEQGLEEEKSVYFTEHVFLEQHLEPWCPPKGPIRHFMELVCVGLSKNPHLTVEKKKEHIEWYRNYFMEKKQVLTEVGAIPAGFDITKTDVKSIEG